MVGFFNVVFDAKMPLKELFPRHAGSRRGGCSMNGRAVACCTSCLVLSALARRPAAPRKKLLVIGEEKGYRHEAVSHAMATIERLGRETGLWDTVIRTDTEALTKKKLEYNAKNLNDFDAVAVLYRRHARDGRPAEGRLPVVHP